MADQQFKSNRKLDAERLRKMQMQQGGRGPGGRFGGLREKPKNVKGTLKKLLKYLSFNKVLIILLFILVLATTILSLSTNIYIKNIVAALGVYDFEAKEFINNPDYNKFITFAIILGSTYLAYCVISFFSGLVGAHIAVGTTRKMRKDLFAKIVKFPISYIDTHQHGDIMSRMTNDVDNVSGAITNVITSLVSGIITLVGCLAIMLFYSPLLTLVSLITLSLSLLITFLMGKFMRPLFVKQQSVLGLLNSQTEEMVTGCKTVMAYNHQEVAEEEFNDFSDNLKKIAITANIWGGSMGPMMNFVGNVGYFLVCFFGAIFITKGIGNGLFGAPLEVAVVITFLTLSKQFTRPINELAQMYSIILNALAGAERVFAMMEEEVEDFSGKVSLDVENMKGIIDFNHVAFAYEKDKPVLRDFHVDIRSGHKIALVGATGSGKTTIVNLLLRFYEIDGGSITIDGIDIRDLSKKELRDAISIVLQDAHLFKDSVENNVKYGAENATDEEVDEALKLANCTSFVKRLPEGKKTILTEGATNISQGQRQLLTIARAVLANPKILILDEATSSVDTRTEKKIQDAMVNLMENRTSIIIAHRLSTIQDADLIVVLDQGRVIEMGNHQELIDHDGVYNKLYQTQFSGLNT